jgi:hypothetical protein
MPSLDLNLGAIVGTIGAVVSILLLLRKGVKLFMTQVRKVSHEWDKIVLILNGRPEVILPETGEIIAPAIKGVLERLSEQDVIIKEVKAELKPNGGNSTKDVVNRIEQEVTGLKSEIAFVSDRLNRHHPED